MEKEHNHLMIHRSNMPLIIKWKPKEDITVYELAMCIPLINSSNMMEIMPSMIDQSKSYMRHFEILFDPNKTE